MFTCSGDWDRAAELFQSNHTGSSSAPTIDAVTFNNLAQVYIYRGNLEMVQQVLEESEKA
jgi:hypothetical protein